MKRTAIITLVLLFAAVASEAQRSRSVRHPSGDVPSTKVVPMYKIWLAEDYASWTDAAAAFMTANGDAMIMKTGDVDSPFVVLRQVNAGSYLQLPPPKYRAEEQPDLNQAVATMSSASWWRAVTTDDGHMIFLSRND